MIRLLQPEIEVEPGRRAQQITTLQGTVGQGAALLRVTNDTPQENAYTIRVKCADPYWQDAWYALQGLPQTAPPHGQPRAGGAGDVADASRAAIVASGKADQHGAHYHWIKLFISAGQTRDVQIAFYVPQDPTGRAGRYPFTVSVEQFVTGVEAGAGTPAARRGRFTEVQGVMVVRPFYEWQMDLLPEEGRRVGLLRRRAPWEVVVTNRGNDWLYCELNLGRSRDVLLDAPTQVIAVPPPEPGEEAFQRSVPLTSVTKLKQWRGDAVAQQMPISATRIDAPSVAPEPEDRFPGAEDAFALGLGNVLAEETSEARQVPTDRVLTYRPWGLPGGGMVGGVLQNGRNLIALVIGLVALLHVVAFAMGHLQMRIKAEPTASRVEPKKHEKLVIAGIFLNGARVKIKKEGGPEEELDSHLGDSARFRDANFANQAANAILMPLMPAQRQFLECTIPPDRYEGSKVTVYVQRLSWLPYMNSLMPVTQCKTLVNIGRPGVEPIAFVTASAPSQAKEGAIITIKDSNEQLGSPGKVTFNGQPASIVSWKEDQVEVEVPRGIVGSAEIVVTRSDNRFMILRNPIAIQSASTPAPNSTPQNPIAGGSPPPFSGSPDDNSGGTGNTGGIGNNGGTGNAGGTDPVQVAQGPTPGPQATEAPRIRNQDDNRGGNRGGKRGGKRGSNRGSDRGSSPSPGSSPSAWPSSSPSAWPSSSPSASPSVLALSAYQLVLSGQSTVAGQASSASDAVSLGAQALAQVYPASDTGLLRAPVSTSARAALERVESAVGGSRSGRALALMYLARARHVYADSGGNDTDGALDLLRWAIAADPSLVAAHTTSARILALIPDQARGQTGTKYETEKEESREALEAAFTLIRNHGGDDGAAEAADVAKTAADLGLADMARAALGRALQLNPDLARQPMVSELQSRLGR